ncbi:hypothetical protein FRC17_001404 [Serendipita sp. 399]|nr:hypothetical protein FRC17_001404 [Serendipita sp. 399]
MNEVTTSPPPLSMGVWTVAERVETDERGEGSAGIAPPLSRYCPSACSESAREPSGVTIDLEVARLGQVKLHHIDRPVAKAFSILLFSMENHGVIDRIPVEIWREVFTIVLQTWLLPGKGDRIFDDLLLFSDGCRSYLEYKRVEDIRRQLRAVCKSWDMLAADSGIGLTVSDFLYTTTPSDSHFSCALRIESSVGYCYCNRCPHQRVTSRRGPPLEYYLNNPSVDLNINPESARIISLHQVERYNIEVFLQQALRLRAFQGIFSFLYDDNKAEMRGTLEHLTHLSIVNLCTEEMTIALHLPHLRFLKLSLNTDLWLDVGEDEVPPEVPLGQWKLPKLTSLAIDGRLTKANYEDFLHFLHNHSTVLENLIVSFTIPDHEQLQQSPIDIRTLQQFSRLKLLGIRQSYVHAGPWEVAFEKNNDKPLQLSLLLCDDDSVLRRFNPEWPKETAKRFIRLCKPPICLFKDIIVPKTWDILNAQWSSRRGRSRLSTMLVFLKTLYDSGIPVSDTDGADFWEGYWSIHSREFGSSLLVDDNVI